MATTDARPVPMKGTAYRLYFEIRDTSGALVTTWAGQDTELSQDGGAFADATNEATEIGTSGVGYLDLTAAEMGYDSVIVKTTVTNTDALPVVITLFPEEAGDLRVNLTQVVGRTVADPGAGVTIGTNVAQVGSEMVLSGDYDAAKTAASATSVNAIATILSGITSLASWLRGLARKGTMDATAKAELNTGGGTYNEATDSLEGSVDSGGSGLTAGQVWGYATRTLTQSAAEIESVVRGSVLTIHRGDSLSVGITGLGSIVGRKLLWFTVKSDPADVDTASIVQIEESSGLLYLNGATAPAVDGEIRVDDEAAGDITIALAAVASAELAAGSYSYDIQWVDASDGVHTLSGGPVRVTPDVTRATS